MELKQPIDLIKRSSWFDLLFLGLLITPASVLAWAEVLRVAAPSLLTNDQWFFYLVVAHFLAIALMIAGSNQYRTRYQTMSLIMGYLIAKKFTMVSFERLREKYGDELTDEYLMDVICQFPQYLRVAKLKDDKLGVARLSGSDRDEMPADAPDEES